MLTESWKGLEVAPTCMQSGVKLWQRGCETSYPIGRLFDSKAISLNCAKNSAMPLPLSTSHSQSARFGASLWGSHQLSFEVLQCVLEMLFTDNPGGEAQEGFH